jgi:hypothetical protein
VIDHRGQQRRGGLESLVVAGLVRQVGKQVAQPGAGEPELAAFAGEAEQHLGDGQAGELGIGQAARQARAARR